VIVVDTNVIVAAIIEQQFSLDDIIKEKNIVVPVTFELEIINVLRKYHYLRNIDIQTINEFHANAQSLKDTFIPLECIIDEAKNISFALNHPIYDCLFLAVAKLKKLPFVSLDRRLMDKAMSLGIEVFAL
jgi:predicted nucleic acid-binding protein